MATRDASETQTDSETGAVHEAGMSRSSLGFMALRANRVCAPTGARVSPESKPMAGDLFQRPRCMALPDGARYQTRKIATTHTSDEFPDERRYW